MIAAASWKEATAFAPESASFPMTKASAYATRAIAEARLGDVAGAQTDLRNFGEAFKAMQVAMKGMSMGMMGSHSGEPLEQLEMEAWLAYASGNSDEAVAKMKAAVNRTRSPMRMGGVPGIPTEEMMGDLLLELHRPAEAFTAYESALKIAPNRFDSVYGAAHSAQLAGNNGVAKRYYNELIRISGLGADRPQLQQARSYVASN